MLWAAVKLPLQHGFIFHPHAGPGMSESMTQRSPSIRARTPSAAPRDCAVSVRTRERRYLLRGGRPWHDPSRPVRAARVRYADASLRGLDDRPGRDDADRDIPPQGDHQFAGQRHDPDAPGAFPLAEIRLIPLGQRALRLPAHPIPGELNTDGLQSRIAGATDPLLPGRLAAVIRRRREAEQAP